jgi:hypothetical protein
MDFIPLVASWCSTGFVGKFGGYQRLQNISRQRTSIQVYYWLPHPLRKISITVLSSSGNDN